MIIKGSSGNIEAVFTGADGITVAVLCHPHPLYGGNMHDGILAVLERTLIRSGVSVLRFNFRGVGASEGQYDDGRGEVEDAIAACQWASAQSDDVILGGYSFGAAVAFSAVGQTRAGRLLLVAPPPALLGNAPAPLVPGVIVTGDRDSFVDHEALRRRIAKSAIELMVVDGCDHFFSTHASSLESACGRVLGLEAQPG